MVLRLEISIFINTSLIMRRITAILTANTTVRHWQSEAHSERFEEAFKATTVALEDGTLLKTVAVGS